MAPLLLCGAKIVHHLYTYLLAKQRKVYFLCNFNVYNLCAYVNNCYLCSSKKRAPYQKEN